MGHTQWIHKQNKSLPFSAYLHKGDDAMTVLYVEGQNLTFCVLLIFGILISLKYSINVLDVEC